jgi:hypothetical protein
LANICTILSTALLAACAGTPPKANFGHDPASQYRVDADDRPQVTVDAAPGVDLLDIDKQRMAQVIASKLEDRRMRNLANNDARDCVVAVTITRYQRGNAFARAMLAGLGQIHIDGAVKVFVGADREKVSEFTIAKTFAWGGIYGSSTSMEDIERTFSDGLAAALTGQEDKKDSGSQGKKK